MDEIIERYKQGKFQKCLELIELQKFSDNLVDNFILQNCSLICKSFVAILQNDQEKRKKIEEELYSFYEKVTSVTELPISVPNQLTLTVIYNLYWWLLFHGSPNVDEDNCDEYLESVNKSLSQILKQKGFCNAPYLKSHEKVIENLCKLKSFIHNESHKTVFLVVDIVIVVLMFVIKISKDYLRDCLKVIDVFMNDLKRTLIATEPLNDDWSFHNDCKLSQFLFKFSLNNTAETFSDLNASSIDKLVTLKSLINHLLLEPRESLRTLQQCSGSSSFVINYLGALNSLKLNRKNTCLGFIVECEKCSVSSDVRVYICVLNGRLSSFEGHHKEAVKHFVEALNTCDASPLPYFYAGHEWGKMGLYDMMAENFEKLLQAVEQRKHKKKAITDFNDLILDWIHPANEITEEEALYALAISYGLNERFYEATSVFERLFESPKPSTDAKERIIQVPNWFTVLHEASITNLLSGNLTRAEEIASNAKMLYQPLDMKACTSAVKGTHWGKDDDWLDKFIEEELLESDTGPKEKATETFYSEEMVYFLPENVMALLILSEVQRIQKTEEHTMTLKRIFTIFSTYLGSLAKMNSLPEGEMAVSRLVKALASKICLAISNVQIQSGNLGNVEKMLKRSLSCNKGDKDVLYSYCKFLVDGGNRREAWKLWNTFSSEKSAVSVESVQSLTLRYFLSSHVTVGELEKIQKEFVSNEF